MDNPFDIEMKRRQANPFTNRLEELSAAPSPVARPDQVTFQGSILPFSKTDRGEVRFDSDAGLLGVAKRAINTPGDALQGRLDPQSDEGIQRAIELASFGTPVNPAVRSGGSVFGGAAKTLGRRQAPTPSTQDLQAAAKIGFKQIDNSDLSLRPDVLRSFADKASITLNKDGLDNAIAPNTFKTLDSLRSIPDDAVITGPNLQSLQKRIKRGGNSAINPEEGAAAGILRGLLDDTLTTVDQRSVLSGRADDFVKTLREANANHAAFRRSEAVDALSRNAELRSASSNSGQNASNKLRQNIASLLLGKQKSRGFDAAETEALEAAVGGSKTANAARTIANVLGKGGGLTSLAASGGGATFGALAGSPTLAAVGAIAPFIGGRLANSIDHRSTSRAFSKASEQVRQRSPLFQQRQATQPFQIDTEDPVKNLVRALLLQNSSAVQTSGN